MRFLKLNCGNGITGPKVETVTINNVSVNIWVVSGKGYEIEYDSSGNEIILSGPADMMGIFVYKSYRSLTCSAGGDPLEDIVFGVNDIEMIEAD